MSVNRSTAGQGRPLDHDLTATILDQTIRVLQNDGYALLRIERIAGAVGCSKATIYRRWSTRAELAAEALTKHSRVGEVPDTGNIIDDLVKHAWQNAVNQQPPPGTDSSRRTLWAVVVEPDVRELFWESFLSTRRAMGRSIIERAIARGELPLNTDGDAILDLIAGLTLYRGAVRNLPLTEADYRRIITAITASPPVTG